MKIHSKYSLILNTVFDVVLSPQKTNIFPNLSGELDKGDFLYPKILQLFIKEQQLEGCLIITASLLKKKTNKNSLQLVRKHNVYIKIFGKNFQRPRFSQIHMGKTASNKVLT